MASPGLFATALQSVAAALSLTNWSDKLKADMATINAGLVRAKLVRATDQSIPDTTPTALSFSGVEYDSNGGAWAVGNPTRAVILVDGVYEVSVAARLAANATGLRSATLKKNAAVELWTASRPAVATAGIATDLSFTQDYTLSAGDYLEVLLVQTSGGALLATTPFNFLSLKKVG